jgi:hypothetical protein
MKPLILGWQVIEDRKRIALQCFPPPPLFQIQAPFGGFSSPRPQYVRNPKLALEYGSLAQRVTPTHTDSKLLGVR